MADVAASPAPSPMWDAIKAMAPSIGQSLVMIVGLLVAIGTTYLVAKPAAEHKVIEAADKDSKARPTPIDETATLDHLLGIHADKISGEIAALRILIEQRFPNPPEPRVAPSRVRTKGIAP